MFVFDWSTIMIGPGSNQDFLFFNFLISEFQKKIPFFSNVPLKEKEIQFFFVTIV